MPLVTVTSGGLAASADFNSVASQVIITCTSSTRPGAPTEGMTIYETDTDKIYVRDGSSNWVEVMRLGAWTTYTPAVTQVSALSTSGSQFAYCRIGGKTIVATGAITITQTGTAGNKITIGLPLPAATRYTSDQHALGSAHYLDSGTTNYQGALMWDSSTTGNIITNTAASALGVGVSIATGNGDTIGYAITYEIA